MNRGFRIEVHVVVYCDICGDIYTDDDGESVCFATAHQAAQFLAVDTITGWAYDGDTIRCDSCLLAEQCHDGHDFIFRTEPYRPITTSSTGPGVIWRNTIRECAVCGLLDIEQDNPRV